MGISKELFFAEREAQLANMTRKELAQEAEQYAMLLMDEREPEEVLSQTLRIEAFATALNKSLKNEIKEPLSYGGVDYSEGQRTSLNFKEDGVWLELNEALKGREELLKARSKLGKSIFDDEGVEVPLVSSSTSTFLIAKIK